jgi:hypothetical protein
MVGPSFRMEASAYGRPCQSLHSPVCRQRAADPPPTDGKSQQRHCWQGGISGAHGSRTPAPRPGDLPRSLSMHIGIYIAITESTIRIDELAREVEARGFESL